MSLSLRINQGIGRLSQVAQDAAPLATRLFLGYSFIHFGLDKLTHFEKTVQFFGQLGIPMPTANAAFIAVLEAVGGVTLILGVGTRLTSLLLASTMVVALITNDRGPFLSTSTAGAEKGQLQIVPFAYLLFLLGFVAYGAGALSIDHFLEKRNRVTPTPMPEKGMMEAHA